MHEDNNQSVFFICFSQVLKVPVEVSLMQELANGPETVGKFATVSLLDWYYLDHEVVLVTERPVPSVTLTKYLDDRGGAIEEQQAKVVVCVCLCVLAKSTSVIQNADCQ